MKKNYFACMLLAGLLLFGGLPGCGSKLFQGEKAASVNPDFLTEVPSESSQEEPSRPISTEEPLPISETSASSTPAALLDVAWQSYSSVDQHDSGYTIQTTVKMSPWIQYSDKATWSSVWSSICAQQNMPVSPFGIGHQEFRDVSDMWVVDNTDNIILTIGTFEFENLSEDSDLSTTNSCDVNLNLLISTRRASMKALYSGGETEYRVKYGGDLMLICSGNGVMKPLRRPGGHMTSNKWGPVPFVIFVSQEITSNDPNGTPNASEITLKIGSGDAFQLPVSQENKGVDSSEKGPGMTAASESADIGDIVLFGSYTESIYFTETGGSVRPAQEPSPIEWQVLDIQDGKALLFSKYVLDAVPYHEKLEGITWEGCTLRRWLNNDFYNQAFSAEEQAQIITVLNSNPSSDSFYVYMGGSDGGRDTKDNVFLLSLDELCRYFNVKNETSYAEMGTGYDELECEATAYARIIKGAPTYTETEYHEYYDTYHYPESVINKSRWWLRSPGGSGHPYYASVVNGNHITYGYKNQERLGVRPAIWVSLESLAASAVVPENEEPAEPYAGAYSDFLSAGSFIGSIGYGTSLWDFTFVLVNIDDDDVPELLILPSADEGMFSQIGIYSYADGHVVGSGYGMYGGTGLRVAPKQGIIEDDSGRQGVFIDTFYAFSHGKATVIKKFKSVFSPGESEKGRYTVDEKELSETDYESQRKAYKDQYRFIDIGTYSSITRFDLSGQNLTALKSNPSAFLTGLNP